MAVEVTLTAAKTRIGQTNMPMRGIESSYNKGSSAASIGRGVFASATRGRPH